MKGVSCGDKNDRPEDLSGLDDKALAEMAVRFPAKSRYADELIRRYTPLIKSAAAKFSREGFPAEDLESEAYLAAVKAVANYDPQKCGSFSAYISVCVNNRLISVIRSPQKNVSSLDELTENISTASTPETIFMARETRSEIAELLSPMEYRVFLLYSEGMSYASAAKKLGVSPKSVDNAVQRIRRKLKKNYGGSV